MSEKRTITVNEFSREVREWITDGADMDDLQQFAAEFYGVPQESVTVNDDDEITIEEAEEEQDNA